MKSQRGILKEKHMEKATKEKTQEMDIRSDLRRSYKKDTFILLFT